MTNSDSTGTKSSGGILAVGCGLMFCVLFPALWTWMAPISVISLTRHADRVSADVQTHLFLVVPYRFVHIEHVDEVDRDFVAGTYSRSSSSRSSTKSEDQGYLVLKGDGITERVPETPLNLEESHRRVRDFVEAEETDNVQVPDSMRLIAVANWKFSVFGGAILSSLTLLYAVGIVVTVFQKLTGIGKRRAATTAPHPAGGPQP